MTVSELRKAISIIDRAIIEGASIPAWEVTAKDVAMLDALRKQRIAYQTDIVNRGQRKLYA